MTSTTEDAAVPSQGGAPGTTDLAAMIREGYAAFARGDLDAIRQDMAADCRWHLTGGDNPFTGTYTGWGEIVGMLGRLLELTGGTWRSELDEVVADADGRRAAAFVTATSTVKGSTLVARQVVAYFARDGQITDVYFQNDDADAMDAHLSR